MTEESSYSILTFFGKDLFTHHKTYEAFVCANWRQSLRKYNEIFKAIEDHQAYDREYSAFIKKLIEKPGCTIRVAVLTEDPEIILGFSSKREDVLDYVFVRHEQRGQKISNALITPNITTFTHMTKMWLPIWQSKYKDWKFNPFA